MEITEITPEWVRQNLGWPVSESDTVEARVLEPANGLMGRVYRVACAGRTFIFKCPPAADSGWRELFLRTGLNDREVQAYAFLGTHGRGARMVAPECYWSASKCDGSGALALEDLTGDAAMARFATGLSYDQAEAAVRTLADLHTLLFTRGGDALSPPYPWLYSASSEGLIAAIDEGLKALPRVAERLPAGSPRRALLRATEVDVHKVLAEAHVGSRLTSLCHGDAWSNNILFREGADPGENMVATLIDWQFAMWGNPLSDVALLMLSSIPTQQRRLWTGNLLRRYHSRLLQCRDLRYGFEECRDDYAMAMNYGGLVAVATLDSYTSGMTTPALESFASRLQGIIEDMPVLFDSPE